MRVRTLLVLFVVGLVVVGVAAAGLDRHWNVRTTGEFEIPMRETDAQGHAVLRLSRDGQSLDYVLVATRIENVVQAHIHVGGPTVNGPVVAFLYGLVASGGGSHNGLLSKGTITREDLVGPLVGQPLSALVDAMRAGNTYVNVHTNDGVDPANTGPGDFPGGEIRGNIPAD